MEERISTSTNPITLRFRVDKTIKSGQPINGRACNLNCIWCHHDYIDHTQSQRNAISNRNFIECIQRVISATTPNNIIVRISGDGEPTITGFEELADLIHSIKQLINSPIIKLTTNGILLESMAQGLMQAGLDGVNISLNSLDPHIYHFYSGIDGVNKVKNSIISALQNGLDTKINILFTRLNAREIDDFISMIEKYPKLEMKFFDLISSDPFARRFYLPMDILEKKLSSRATKTTNFINGYSGKEYKMLNGGSIFLKTSWINNCPNMDCFARDSCLEGCRSSIRIRADGILQPCGVRKDNTLDLLSSRISAQDIRNSLQSGGKIR